MILSQFIFINKIFSQPQFNNFVCLPIPIELYYLSEKSIIQNKDTVYNQEVDYKLSDFHENQIIFLAKLIPQNGTSSSIDFMFEFTANGNIKNLLNDVNILQFNLRLNSLTIQDSVDKETFQFFTGGHVKLVANRDENKLSLLYEQVIKDNVMINAENFVKYLFSGPNQNIDNKNWDESNYNVSTFPFPNDIESTSQLGSANFAININYNCECEIGSSLQEGYTLSMTISQFNLNDILCGSVLFLQATNIQLTKNSTSETLGTFPNEEFYFFLVGEEVRMEINNNHFELDTDLTRPLAEISNSLITLPNNTGVVTEKMNYLIYAHEIFTEHYTKVNFKIKGCFNIGGIDDDDFFINFTIYKFVYKYCLCV